MLYSLPIAQPRGVKECLVSSIENERPMWDLIISVLGGLILFLYAISRVSEVLQDAVGEGAQKWLLRFTANAFTGILTGIVVTMLLGSSSAVIILAIVLVNAKMLTFRQTMGIVLGANIGTTMNSQLIALNLGQYAPLLMLVGFLMAFLRLPEPYQRGGKVVLYLGMLFFGLFTIEKAVEPIREEPYVLHILARIESPLFGAMVGALVTFVIQSSSATVGMAIILAKKGLLGLSGGIAVMLGAELGTCSDTLLATINGSRQAVKTGLFHLLFNLLSIALGLLFFEPFLGLVASIGRNLPVERSVANAHLLFNIGGVVLLGVLLPFFEQLLNRLIPEKNQPESRTLIQTKQ